MVQKKRGHSLYYMLCEDRTNTTREVTQSGNKPEKCLAGTHPPLASSIRKIYICSRVSQI